MMGSYTPGKWKVLKCSEGDYVIQQKKLSYRTHPPMFGDGRYHKEVAITDNEADAVLIATAPEMVEWMKSVIRAFCEDEIGALDELDNKKVEELFAKGAGILHRALTGEEDQHGRQLENGW